MQEDKKFLDLDMVAQQIPNLDDRSLFQEAVNCYFAGSHRAAAILSWYAAANCLKRRIFELEREGDGIAQQEARNLSPIGEGVVGEEETLINSARKCELIDDFEEKSLRFARDMRNKCAHPTGFVPPAEAIRNVLFISSQYVLCRKGYRGVSYIRNMVTTQFDDRNFLANEPLIPAHCREIVDRVPRRLWPQFVKIAAEERSKSHTETWRKNAYTFFRHLVKLADDQMVEELAMAMQAFEPSSPEFFAVLVGIDRRVVSFWDHHKRSQTRYHLRQSSAVRLRPEEVHAWAVICEQDGLDDDDLDLLRDKFVALARFLPEEELIIKQRPRIVQLIEVLLRDDSVSSSVAGGCRHLFPTTLFDRDESEGWSQTITSIVDEIIRRFVRDDKHRKLVETVQEWNSMLIIQLLESAQLFWSECSEDNPEDVVLLFEARNELEKRNPLSVPSAFLDTIGLILDGSLFPEWRTEQSIVGANFFAQLSESDFGALDIDPASFDWFPADSETNEFWGAKLGARITERQDQLLGLLAGNGKTVQELSSLAKIPQEDVTQDIKYLLLQGMIAQEDDRFMAREDLKSVISASRETLDV